MLHPFARAARGAALGLTDGVHDAGAAWVGPAGPAGEGGLLAVDEERLTRRKNQGGFPHRALDWILSRADPRETGVVAVAGQRNPHPLTRAFRPLQRLFEESAGSVFRPEDGLRARVGDRIAYGGRPAAAGEVPVVADRALAAILRRALPPALRGAPVRFVDHHLAHAAGAFLTSPFETALAVVADGLGDGASLTVWRCDPRGMTRLWAAPAADSLGIFYAEVTRALGFRPFRDEGKLTGLAAHGDAGKVEIAFPFEAAPGRLRYLGPTGLRIAPWCAALARYRREDVAAWVQEHVERALLRALSPWLRGGGPVAFAGGLAANVSVNRRLAEHPAVSALWVYPHMGDGGLALGAALALTGERRPLGHVFLGPSYPESEVEEALRRGGFRIERPAEPHENVASALASGEVVAVFSGQLELGPRALGGRSLLAPADRPEVLRRLGEALGRPLFMPFAPAILAEDLTRYLKMPEAAAPSAAFMTLAVPATGALRRELPAAAHEDGTVRPQIVKENDASGLHAILAAYKRRTGHGAAINTSFNGHGEPIVASPADAAATARRCGIRKLAMGPFWAES